MSMARFFSNGRYLLLLSLLVLPLASTLVTACGNGRGPHDVVFWTSTTDKISKAAQNQIITAFHQANPDLRVKIVGVPGGISNLAPLITAVRGGSGPDAYLLDRFTVSQFAAIGLLEDLQPYTTGEKDDLARQYLPFAWQETQFQGQTYALPMDTDARALYYNKAMLSAVGVDPSILDPKHGPISLARLKEISARVDHRDARGAYDRLGFIPWYDQALPVTWGLDANARFIDRAKCQITPTEPSMVQALQLIASWSRALDPHKVAAFLDTYTPANAPPAQDPFYTGHLAMKISGDWAISGLQKYAPNVQYGLTYIPDFSGKTPFTWSGGFSLVIPTNASNPIGAYRFIRYMAGPEGQRIYTQITAHMPTWHTLLNDESLFSGNHKFFSTMLAFSHSRPPMPVWPQLWDEFATASDKVRLGEAKPIDALQSVYNRVQPQLQQYCPL